MKALLKVLLVAGEDLHREALSTSLRAAGLEVVTCDPGVEEIRDAVRQGQGAPDVVLLVLQDVLQDGPQAGPRVGSQGGRQGQVDAIAEACSVAGSPPIVVLAPDGQGSREGWAQTGWMQGGAWARGAGRALAAGATGYILASATVDELVRALRVAATSGLGPVAMRGVATRFYPTVKANTFPALTERQVSILEMTSSGMSDRLIARKLMVSHWLVEAEVGRMLKAVGARNRAELVALAIRAGVLPGASQRAASTAEI